MAQKTHNYHKESGYAAQTKYQKEHYYQITLRLPAVKKSDLDSIAQNRGVSVTCLIKEAILQTYGIDCFTQK
jgi:hypothetical protein